MLDIANIDFCAKCKSLHVLCRFMTYDSTLFLLHFLNIMGTKVLYTNVAKVIAYMKPKTTIMQYIIES